MWTVAQHEPGNRPHLSLVYRLGPPRERGASDPQHDTRHVALCIHPNLCGSQNDRLVETRRTDGLHGVRYVDMASTHKRGGWQEGRRKRPDFLFTLACWPPHRALDAVLLIRPAVKHGGGPRRAGGELDVGDARRGPPRRPYWRGPRRAPPAAEVQPLDDASLSAGSGWSLSLAALPPKLLWRRGCLLRAFSLEEVDSGVAHGRPELRAGVLRNFGQNSALKARSSTTACVSEAELLGEAGARHVVGKTRFRSRSSFRDLRDFGIS